MGIKGLWTKVLRDTATCPERFNECITRGSTLHVDASGFMFHMYEAQEGNHGKSTTTIYRELGGSYKLYREVLLAEIKRLTAYLGLNLIFYFDGPTSYYKGDTTLKRKRQLEVNWQHLFELTLGDCVVEQNQLPIPPLSTSELIYTLTGQNIKIVHCSHEADQEIALGCSRGTRSFAYTSDRCVILVQTLKLNYNMYIVARF
jgi:hypothetical protein